MEKLKAAMKMMDEAIAQAHEAMTEYEGTGLPGKQDGNDTMTEDGSEYSFGPKFDNSGKKQMLSKAMKVQG